MNKKGNKRTIVLGLMSGTSLDGLDLALCEFSKSKKTTSFTIVKAKTIKYSDYWANLLKSAPDMTAMQFMEANAAYGKFIGKQINVFLKSVNKKPELIASHGHTVFHQPKLGFSTQLGCGATIAATCGITTVCDFRSLDVAFGGQGAPLVPIGDELLFGNYHACLNIGGIANISFGKGKKRLAYDCCEANMLLNFLAEKCGKNYDAGGKIAASGMVNSLLLKNLNGLGFYSIKGAKSLGREWFEKEVLRLIQKAELPVKDLLATSTEHIADIIASELTKQKLKSVLVTGGGAFNTQLIDLISSKTNCRIILPSKEIINFKEALIFAYLGYLRINGTENCLQSVTSAKRNSCGGAVYVV